VKKIVYIIIKTFIIVIYFFQLCVSVKEADFEGFTLVCKIIIIRLKQTRYIKAFNTVPDFYEILFVNF
jgi:hypothetical protein